MNGICAAAGKLGALIGSFAFPLLVARAGYPAVFASCALTAAVGALLSWGFVADDDGGLDDPKWFSVSRAMSRVPSAAGSQRRGGANPGGGQWATQFDDSVSVRTADGSNASHRAVLHRRASTTQSVVTTLAIPH